LLVGQLLEIILTFFTVNVDCAPEAAPVPPAVAAPAPAPLLGLDDEEAAPPASLPVIRTWWPTWSLSFAVSPASCQVFPDWSVNVQLPAEPPRQPSIEVPLSVEVCVVCVVVVWVVVELVSGVAGCWLGAVDDGDVDCWLDVSGVVCCGVLGVVCATAQAADSNRIAVIKKVFLIYVPPVLLAFVDSGPKESEEAALSI
jgi:hypothetical protein